MFPRYDEVRQERFSTLGDAYAGFERDSEAFCAGVQHALDKMLHDADFMRVGGFQDPVLPAKLAETKAISILTNALNGEPQ